MGITKNPFSERASERATPDAEFVRLFSPNLLDKLGADIFQPTVRLFLSSPGCGKTTLLRAFTPGALRAFWNASRDDSFIGKLNSLNTVGALSKDGPRLLGVLLNCSSGYADLPPNLPVSKEGLFRALVDCRVVMRALRGIVTLLGLNSVDALAAVKISYKNTPEFRFLPILDDALSVYKWAERKERAVYAAIDSIDSQETGAFEVHHVFESVVWLQDLLVEYKGKTSDFKKVLMIDDVHKLTSNQRDLMIKEIAELRSAVPVWLSQRTIALNQRELLAQGAREERDIIQIPLDNIWAEDSQKRHAFQEFARSVIQGRFEKVRNEIPAQFTHLISDEDDNGDAIPEYIDALLQDLAPFRGRVTYAEWISEADRAAKSGDLAALNYIQRVLILIARREGRQQLSFEEVPVAADELAKADESGIKAAAEIFLHERFNVPYYYGLSRLAQMATFNIEELLRLCAALYDRLGARQLLSHQPNPLNAKDQEHILREAAKRKWDFIPKAHSEGRLAQRMLKGMAGFCRDRTFVPNAPIVPGVTGVWLSSGDLTRLTMSKDLPGPEKRLSEVLSECVAENLLLAQESNRNDSGANGTIFYLNRTICAQFGLPLGYGGWQRVTILDLLRWMDGGSGKPSGKSSRLELAK